MNQPLLKYGSFEKLFKDYFKLGVLIAVRYTHDVELAREITQDTFVTLYKKRESIRITTTFEAYLHQSVKNTFLNHVKKESIRNRYHQDMVRHSNTQFEERSLEYQDFLAQLNTHIANLPPRCKEIFTLNRFEGLSNKQIAEKLSISQRTVETHISHALKVLRQNLRLLSIILIFSLLRTTCGGIGDCHKNISHESQSSLFRNSNEKQYGILMTIKL